MTNIQYHALVTLKGTGVQKVTVVADDPFKAKAMIEARYGKGSYFTGTTRS